MRKYCEIAKAYMKTQLIWRTDTLIDIVLSVIKILLAWILWSVLFQGKEQIAGMSFEVMLSYYVVSFYLYQLDKSSEISQQMTVMIRNGKFSKYMVLPVRTTGYFIAMEAGKIIFSAGTGLLAFAVWIFLLPVPFVHTSDVQSIFCGTVLVMLGLLFMAELNYYLGILTLKYEEISTFLMIKDNLAALVTGAVIPLVLLPDWLTAGMRFLPFYYITYLPSMLFVGAQTGEAAGGILVLSVWCMAFIVLNHVTYEKYRVKFDGAGI